MNDLKLIDVVSDYQQLYNLFMYNILYSIEKTNENICSCLKPSEENPWHNITNNNKQYEWEIKTTLG